MKFGLCCSPELLQFSEPQFHDNIARLQNSGVEYLEFPVAATEPEGNARQFEELQKALESSPLQVEALNSFIPGHYPITGPDVDLHRLLEYSSVALSRCKTLDADVVVLGSGRARRIPDGFDQNKAEAQFIEFCRELGPIAHDNRITICIEPLNSNEDNLILSVEQGARLVDEVAHSNIQLLADLYHIEIENEPLENVANAGARLRHAHVADTGRVAPGFATEGEADFQGFFAALQRAGYGMSTHTARCSFEGSYHDIFAQAEPLIDVLRERFEGTRA